MALSGIQSYYPLFSCEQFSECYKRLTLHLSSLFHLQENLRPEKLEVKDCSLPYPQTNREQKIGMLESCST